MGLAVPLGCHANDTKSSMLSAGRNVGPQSEFTELDLCCWEALPCSSFWVTSLFFLWRQQTRAAAACSVFKLGKQHGRGWASSSLGFKRHKKHTIVGVNRRPLCVAKCDDRLNPELQEQGRRSDWHPIRNTVSSHREKTFTGSLKTAQHKK